MTNSKEMLKQVQHDSKGIVLFLVIPNLALNLFQDSFGFPVLLKLLKPRPRSGYSPFYFVFNELLNLPETLFSQGLKSQNQDGLGV